MECFSDDDCAGRACELDLRSFQLRRCVDSPLGRANACADSEAAHRCLLRREVCGCASAADCAAGRSRGPGAICEDALADAGARDAALGDAAASEDGVSGGAVRAGDYTRKLRATASHDTMTEDLAKRLAIEHALTNLGYLRIEIRRPVLGDRQVLKRAI